jgi:hypothetical protein
MPTDPAGLVYGTIAVGALLAAESARQETYAKTIAAVIVTMLLYWLAHSYAEYTGRRMEESKPFQLGGLARMMAREVSVLIGAAIPLLVLLITWAVGVRLTNAVTAGIFSSAAMIVVIEVTIGIRARLPGRDVVAQTAFGAVLGLLVITLRVLLH